MTNELIQLIECENFSVPQIKKQLKKVLNSYTEAKSAQVLLDTYKYIIKIRNDYINYLTTNKNLLCNQTPKPIILKKLFNNFTMYSVILNFVVESPNCPQDVLLAFATDASKHHRMAVAKNPNVPLNILNQLIKETDVHINKYIDAEEEYYIAAEKEYSIMKQDNEDYSDYIDLTEDTDIERHQFRNEHIKAIALNNPTYIEYLIAEIKAKESDPNNAKNTYQLLKSITGGYEYTSAISAKIAASSSCSLSLLTKFVASSESYRLEVAKNPKCPLNLLTKLADDKKNSVKIAVTKNPKCTLDLLIKLIEDENENVRFNVIKNPNCPKELVEYFCKNTTLKISELLADSDCPSKVIEFFFNKSVTVDNTKAETHNKADYNKTKLAVVEHKNCPCQILAKVATDKLWNYRSTVGRNLNCPVDVLEQLAKDDVYIVRTAVAKNTSCPQKLLAQLADDAHFVVRAAVAKNPNCPDAILKKLSKDEHRIVKAALKHAEETEEVSL